MDIKILKDLFLTIEWRNLWKRQDQIVYKRIMVDLGLLKSGKVELQSTIDRGNLRIFLGIHEPLLGRNAHSARYGELIHERTGNLCQRIAKDRLILKISSWEVTQKNL